MACNILLQHAPGPLTEHTRLQILLVEWPTDQGCARGRSFIVDLLTTKTTNEVPFRIHQTQEIRKSMHVWIDHALKGCTAGVWAFHFDSKLHGSMVLGRFHALLNIAGDAKGSCRMALLKLEWLASLGLKDMLGGRHQRHRKYSNETSMPRNQVPASAPPINEAAHAGNRARRPSRRTRRCGAVAAQGRLIDGFVGVDMPTRNDVRFRRC